MRSHWPLAPDGAIAVAVFATQERNWAEAIRLWRDIFRHGDHDALAAGCIAEAAWHLGRMGLFDHMVAHCPDSEPLIASFGAEPGTCDAAMTSLDPAPDRNRLDKAIAGFRDNHPLGSLCPELPDEIGPTERRVSVFSRIRAPRAAAVQAAIAEYQAKSDQDGVKRYAEMLIRRSAPPEALHWAILAINRQPDSHRLFDQLLGAFASYPLRAEERALVNARLNRGVGYPALARLVLRDALTWTRRSSDRAKVRKRLATLAADHDRWLDDIDILTAADFDGLRPEREAVREMVFAAEGQIAPVLEPLEAAFEWLFKHHLGDVQKYSPENRLLMVGNTLGCGGMERVLARTYRHFSDSGQFDAVDLALLDFADGEASAFYAEEAGVSEADVIRLDRDGGARLPCSLLPGSWKARGQKLYDHIAATRPRVIHAWNDLTGLLSAYAGLAAGCPKIIIHLHHAPAVPRSGRAEPISSYPDIYRTLRVRDDVTTMFCAEAAARGYAEWWRTDQDERFHILYNGFDWAGSAQSREEAKQGLGIAADAPVIGTVFRFSEVKQPKIWAEAAIALAKSRSETKFLLVGDGPMRDEVACLFRDAGMADAAIMPGQVDTVADHLAAMDMFWLTSRTEGLPNVLIEAQFSGVPVVSFDVGGAGETFLPGTSGLLVDAGDIAALVKVSIGLIDDPARRAAMAESGRRNAEQSFSADTFFDHLAAAYGSFPAPR